MYRGALLSVRRPEEIAAAAGWRQGESRSPFFSAPHAAPSPGSVEPKRETGPAAIPPLEGKQAPTKSTSVGGGVHRPSADDSAQQYVLVRAVLVQYSSTVSLTVRSRLAPESLCL